MDLPPTSFLALLSLSLSTRLFSLSPSVSNLCLLSLPFSPSPFSLLPLLPFLPHANALQGRNCNRIKMHLRQPAHMCCARPMCLLLCSALPSLFPLPSLSCLNDLAQRICLCFVFGEEKMFFFFFF